MNSQNPGLQLPLALACAILGGVVGHFLFIWIARQGFEALVLPGALVGISAGMIMKQRSIPLMIICALLGLVSGVFSEWRAFPFIKDSSFSYFVTHLHDLRPITLLMLAMGTAAGAYFARGKEAPVTAENNRD